MTWTKEGGTSPRGGQCQGRGLDPVPSLGPSDPASFSLEISSLRITTLPVLIFSSHSIQLALVNLGRGLWVSLQQKGINTGSTFYPPWKQGVYVSPEKE